MGLIKRFFEKRATLRNPPDWLYRAFTGGGPTASGEAVGPDNALTLSSYYSAIRAISEDVAKLPLILYRRLDPRGKVRATQHPLYSLLHDSPNDEMSSMSFRETLILHAIGWGNGIAEIVRNPTNQMPLALWPLDPARVRIDRGADKRVRYTVSLAEGGEAVLGQRDVFHLHGLGFDGLTGYSVAHLARESIGEAIAMSRSSASFFANQSFPAGVIECPNPMTPADRQTLRETLEELHKGPRNTGKVGIFHNGIKYHPLAIPNRDAQYIESRKFTVEELCRWLRIPPHKIASLERATFSNIEHQSIEYVTDTLAPWLVRFEQEISRKLLPRGSDLFAEHLVDGLLRGDTASRFAAYHSAILGGWMTRNEVRERENLNPIDGADELLLPLNSVEQNGNGTAGA